MQGSHRSTRWSIFSLAGWLFTDLFLAMMMLFLIASSAGSPPPPPAPPPPPCLERHSLQMNLQVDYGGLLGNNASAIAQVQTQVRAQAALNNRRAGFVITYGGTPNEAAGNIATAVAVANKVNGALQQLGQQQFVFTGTVYHDPLLLLGSSFATITVEIYLYAVPGHCDG